MLLRRSRSICLCVSVSTLFDAPVNETAGGFLVRRMPTSSRGHCVQREEIGRQYACEVVTCLSVRRRLTGSDQTCNLILHWNDCEYVMCLSGGRFWMVDASPSTCWDRDRVYGANYEHIGPRTIAELGGELILWFIRPVSSRDAGMLCMVIARSWS